MLISLPWFFIVGTTAFTEEPEDSEEAQIEAVKKKIMEPYKSANAIYLYVGRHLFGNLDSYTGIRSSVNIGIGGMMTTYFMSSSGRLGFDFQIGRRMILSPTAYWIGSSVIPLSETVTVRTKQESGGGFMISFGF